MQRDRDSIYSYLRGLFYEYVNPSTTEIAVDIDGKLWTAANDLAEEEKKPIAQNAA